jgi:predicted  nucleic acid-binding Zn-ribbon protein
MILNLTKLNHELTSLRSDKVTIMESVTNITKELESFKEINKNLLAEKTQLEATIKDLQSKMDSIKTDAVATVVAVEESVNKKVVQNLAAIGVAEGTVKDEVTSTASDNTPDDVYNKYESLSGKEKIEFFKKNEAIIFKAMKKLHANAPTFSTQFKTVNK